MFSLVFYSGRQKKKTDLLTESVAQWWLMRQGVYIGLL